MNFINLTELTTKEQTQIEDGVIQVNGSTLNRIALGVVAAYFKLNPDTTFDELKSVFPDSINPTGPKEIKSIFKPFTTRDLGVVNSFAEMKKEFKKNAFSLQELFFTERIELFETSDRVTVIVSKYWESENNELTESALQNLIKVAVEHGIVVNKFKCEIPFTSETYSLDIINPQLFEEIVSAPVIRTKKNKKINILSLPSFWMWNALGAASIFTILFFIGVFTKEDKIPLVNKKKDFKIEKTLSTEDVGEIDSIGKNIEIDESDIKITK